MALHGFVVGCHHCAVFEHRYFLGPKQHFGHARLHGRGRVAQQMAQQNLGELLHQHRRHINPLALEQGQVGRLQRGRGQQSVAKAQPNRIVVGRIPVQNSLQHRRAYAMTGRVQQGVMQGQLGRAGLCNRRDFGALQQVTQKIVSQRQMPLSID